MNILKAIYYLYCDIGLHEMANLRTKQTGLEPVIQISGKGGAKHAPRIKVSNIPGTFSSEDNFSVTTDGGIIGRCKIHRSHLQDVMDWIQLNRDHIHKVWYNSGDMDIEDVVNGFKRV